MVLSSNVLNTDKNVIKGTITTVSTYTLGLVMPAVAPLDVTPFLQDVAFSISIIVGLATLLKLYCFFKDRLKKAPAAPQNDEED